MYRIFYRLYFRNNKKMRFYDNPHFWWVGCPHAQSCDFVNFKTINCNWNIQFSVISYAAWFIKFVKLDRPSQKYTRTNV